MKKTRTSDCPEAGWFMTRTDSFRTLWDSVPWQVNGDRTLKALLPAVRKMAVHINKLPENFLPSVLDQHLAVLSQEYEYQILDILEDIGDDRYFCRNSEDEAFYLWSPALTKSRKGGGISFLSAIIPLEDNDGSPVPAITYGPVLPWNSLTAADFHKIGEALARDLIRLRGLSAVIRRDPSPFWASWTMSTIPPAYHGPEEVVTCWMEGSFQGSPETVLSGGGWEKTVIGKRTRWRDSGEKPFFERCVYFDDKTNRGMLLGRMMSPLVGLRSSFDLLFVPDASEPDTAPPVLEMVFTEILKKPLPFNSWTAPFDRADERERAESKRKNPEAAAAQEKINAAMQELMDTVNSGGKPDWREFEKKHGLDQESIRSIKEMLAKYGVG